MSNEIDVWTGILTKAIDTVPGTKPDRATYLRKVISPIAGKEAAEKAVQGLSLIHISPMIAQRSER